MVTRTVIFDMDGTLVQSRGAAWEVFQDTIARFDLPMSHPEQFFDLFRANFFAALRDFVGEPTRANAVAEHFLTALRERYTPELIPGMADVVHALAGHYSLAVISSNAMGAIRRTLDHSGVATCFAHVFSGDVENDKSASIRRILADPSYTTIRRCAPDYVESGQVGPRPAASEIVLVTDTIGDVREGTSCGIRVIGVAWGMHTAEELRAAGAEFVALWPQELVAVLLPDGSCTPGGCQCLTCRIPAPVGAAGRDVRAETAAASAVRRARRTVPAPKTAGPACGCAGPSCSAASVSRDDPYLSYALSIIAAGGKVNDSDR
jgi:phosphoglycolate phosphatase